MKKILFACMISAAIMAPAHAEGPYIGFGVTGFDKPQGSNDNKASFKLFGGYDFNNTWGVEAGMVGLPEYKVWNPNKNSYGDAQGATVFVAAKATTPIIDKLSLITKLGIAQSRMTFSDGLTDSHYNSTGLYAGIGLKYAFTEKTAVTLELERLGRAPKNIVGSARRETLSVNVSYSF